MGLTPYPTNHGTRTGNLLNRYCCIYWILSLLRIGLIFSLPDLYLCFLSTQFYSHIFISHTVQSWTTKGDQSSYINTQEKTLVGIAINYRLLHASKQKRKKEKKKNAYSQIVHGSVHCLLHKKEKKGEAKKIKG